MKKTPHAKRIAWLKANPKFWAGMGYSSPDLGIRNQKLIALMKAEGLYSVKTNDVDIRVMPLLDSIRKKRLGIKRPVSCPRCSTHNGYDTRHERPVCKK